MLVFSTVAPAVAPAPNRTDIAFFAGYVARRRGVPLPEAVLDELEAQGWRHGPWGRSETVLQSALQLPITVESWDAFDALFAWEARPLRASGGARCATYLGAAVRSFFANGGRRAVIVRAGDPWPYIETAKRRADLRRDRIRAIVPDFADVAAAPFDPFTPNTWRGLYHLYGLPDATIVVLPDLADACAAMPVPPLTTKVPPIPPEGFVECSEDEPAPEPDLGLTRVAAPRADSVGYAAWRLAAADVRQFLVRHRRDCYFVGALPLPDRDNRRPADDGPVYAESDLVPYLRRVGVLEDEGVHVAPVSTAASAFIQLAWPWIATRRSSDLPERLEPADGLLAGVIAQSALARGTFRAVAGTPLQDVVGATPFPDWGLGADSPTAKLAERVCLIAREPDGWTLVSDVTTSPDAAWRPGGVSRLVASVLRAARRLGESLVFEANGPLLWTRLERAMEELLTDYWREGGLRGETSSDAFEVRCNRSTMTQNDIDAGRLVAEVTLAPAASIERIVIVLAVEAGNAASVQLRAVA
ncbi:MAG TPA: phage tail protein [Burkholderiales bacterium]|nr:phage tail protein [Burkholderiales bacterium]